MPSATTKSRGKQVGRPPSSRQRGRTRTLLIEAATELFAKQGIEATTIDEIVDEAGVAKGTFYNYFQDRGELANETAVSIRMELGDRATALNEEIIDPVERIARAVRFFVSYGATYPTKSALMVRLYQADIPVTDRINQPVLDDLTLGIDKGSLKVPSLLAATHILIGTVMVALKSMSENGGDEATRQGGAFATEIAIVVLQGLGVPANVARRAARRPFDVPGMELPD